MSGTTTSFGVSADSARSPDSTKRNACMSERQPCPCREAPELCLHVCTVIFCGLASSIFLLVAAFDPAWVESEYTPSGLQKDLISIEIGLTAAKESTLEYDTSIAEEYRQTTYVPVSIFTAQMNEVVKAMNTDGPAAVSVAQNANSSEAIYIAAVNGLY